MKKNILLLFFVLAHTFVFSAEENSKQQFLAMTIEQAHAKYGNGKLGLDINSDYMQQQPKVEKILGKENDTAEYKILLHTFRMIVSDFKKQDFYMCSFFNPETQTIGQGFLNFAQEEIASLTIEAFKIMLLANNESHIVSRQELDLFANLPSALQDKMRSYNYLHKDTRDFPLTDHRIKIECRPKITRSHIIQYILTNDCTFLLGFGLGSLLYTHYIIKHHWDNITGAPDLSIVARNAELEITNNLIDNLKKNNTPGAENLIKIALEDPLKYTISDHWHFIKPLLPISFFLQCILAHHYLLDNHMHNQKYKFIKALAIFTPMFPFLLFLSSIIPMAYYNPNNDLPSYLLTFMTPLLAFALVWRIKEDTQNFIKSSGWEKKSIEFEEDKTVAECINKYLNDPNLEIK